MRDELTLIQWQYLASLSVTNRSLVLCQKPPKRRQTSKAPNPMRKEPPSKANSFGICTIGMRAEPVSNTPKKSRVNPMPQHFCWLQFRACRCTDLRKFMKSAQQPDASAGLLNRTKCFERGKIDWSLNRLRLWWSDCGCHANHLLSVQQFLRIPQMGDDS